MVPSITAFAVASISVLVASAAGPPQGVDSQRLDLAGTWQFQLDPQDRGEMQQWFDADLPDKLNLPGSLPEQGFGDAPSTQTAWTGDIVDKSWFTAPQYEKYRQPGNLKIPFWLQPKKHYVGAAWYQRMLTIPQTWQGKRITLSLERCHWFTDVWVDGKQVGSADSLSTPHVYDLTGAMSPGGHRLTVRVDNRVKIGVGENAHSVSDHTQSNWNGIIGGLRLAATDPVWIDNVQIYPEVRAKTATVQITIGQRLKEDAVGTLTVRAHCGDHTPPAMSVPFQAAGPGNTVTLTYPLGSSVRLWDEFAPNVYQLTVALQSGQNRDERIVDFGMRDFTTRGTQFVLNDRPIFLRGTLECNIFPLTGYPPMDTAEWQRVIRICQAHGLNHMRFHSHCPPEAAFAAADALGFYLQVECAAWATVGDGKPIDQWLYAEAARILRAYGNHPSFVLMAQGNEPGGRKHTEYLAQFVNHLKKTDARRCYTSAAGWPAIPENQYHNLPGPRIQQWGEGLKSRINARPPETTTDYRALIRKYDVPVVSHEIGQWCVYPNFDEIKKYTGVLKAKNFEIFRDTLAANHMGDQARDFLMASGRLQTLCYKEEIESALRTPRFGGFQLLDLHDFPGQGTALVGVLDPFWDSKPYVSAAEFRRFCNATVPLARMNKRIWTTDETFAADVEMAHFGAEPIKGAVTRWIITSGNKEIASGELPVVDLPTGKLTGVGRIEVPLDRLDKAQQLKLSVTLQGTDAANDWDVWAYPPTIAAAPADEVVIVSVLDDAALARLRAGGKVLLLADPKSVQGGVAAGFSSIFWNTAWTRGQAPHTLGILCDPKHPALAAFPTESHSNFQWWELVHGSGAMVLDDMPAKLRPIVQLIDTWFNNRRLGLAFEARVAGGKLLVCSIDLHDDLAARPAARQMRHALLRYMASSRFAPSHKVSVDQVTALFKP